MMYLDEDGPAVRLRLQGRCTDQPRLVPQPGRPSGGHPSRSAPTTLDVVATPLDGERSGPGLRGAGEPVPGVRRVPGEDRPGHPGGRPRPPVAVRSTPGVPPPATPPAASCMRLRPTRAGIVVTVTKSAQSDRCEWCNRPVAQSPGPGRPRRFCCRSHRQRAYEARVRADSLGIPAGQVVVAESELARLHDRLYRLESAIEDVDADLARSSEPRPTGRPSSISATRRVTWSEWSSNR